MDDERAGRFDHLLAGPAREAVSGDTYGAWRAIDAPEAASLSFGFPFPGSFPAEDLRAAAEAVLDEASENALQYVGGPDADHLVEAVRDRAGERGIDVEEDGVSITNGATHALDAVCGALLDPGDTVVVGAPTFMGALSVFRNYGVDITGVPVDGDGLDVDALSAELRARREAGRPAPKVVYVVPNFQNPTGVTLSRDRRERLVDLAAEYDFLVVEDDAYGALRYDGDPVPPLAALDDAGRVLRIGTFSKTIAPGVRTGWLLGDPELVAAAEQVSPGGSDTFVRSVLGRYCAEGHLESNVEYLRAAYRERRDLMLDALSERMPPGTEYSDPDGGFFVWVELPEGVDAAAMLPAAAEEGVVYLPGEMFSPDGGGERRLRISFSHAPPEEMERGIAALGRATKAALADQ